MQKRAPLGNSFREIAEYLQTSGEAGADLGSDIERILVRGGWVTARGVNRKALGALWMHHPGTEERRLGEVIRRMYGKDEEWDADLGPDLERILGVAGSGSERSLANGGAVAGAVAGGMVAGPVGALVGALLGGLLGEDADTTYTVTAGRRTLGTGVSADTAVDLLREARGHATIIDDATGRVVVADTDGSEAVLDALPDLLHDYEQAKRTEPTPEVLRTLRAKKDERYHAVPHDRIAGYYVILDEDNDVLTEARSREEALTWTSDIRDEG